MYYVETSRITHVADGTSDYVFPCRQPVDFSLASGYEYFDTLESPHLDRELADISEVRREDRMWKLYESRIIPRLEAGESVRLNGTFTKRIYDHVRELYRSLGAFDETENRYRIPVAAPITLGVDIVNLVYRSTRKPSIYLSQWAIRANIAALNDGIVERVYVRPDDTEAGEYLSQSHVQLQRLALALDGGWNALANPVSFTLRAPSPSWSEALHE